MKKVYKFNKEWLDLLLENKDNENASFVLSDNDTRILLTYIEILQNRIDKALNFIDCHFKEMVADEEAQELKSILKESGE